MIHLQHPRSGEATLPASPCPATNPDFLHEGRQTLMVPFSNG
jgi:hypothetical protein